MNLKKIATTLFFCGASALLNPHATFAADPSTIAACKVTAAKAKSDAIKAANTDYKNALLSCSGKTPAQALCYSTAYKAFQACNDAAEKPFSDCKAAAQTVLDAATAAKATECGCSLKVGLGKESCFTDAACFYNPITGITIARSAFQTAIVTCKTTNKGDIYKAALKACKSTYADARLACKSVA